ncbi:MAG: tyrosine-type recombinase/integrase [Ruminococcus sp.]|nr:tyrosine-type recombinase/integrase [Ruminococcus sp.]
MARRGENIYKRKDGRYEGRYPSGYAQDGKTKYRSVYAKSYQEVKEKLLKLKADKQQFQSAGKLTVKILFEEWLCAIKFRVKSSTYANYQMKVNKHILPIFGGLRYENLSAQMIHDFIQKKISSGLSPKYVSDIVIVFKTMTKYVSRVHRFRNLIADVILPKLQKKETQLFSENQQKQLCRYLLKNQNHTSLCILMSIYTGLRIGEICGLQWSDIDFEKSILTVRRTIQRIHTGNKTKLQIDTPKSSSSQRSVPIPEFLMNLLKIFRKQNNFYLLSGTEQPAEPRTMQRRFKAILKKANLPSVNYHSIRHLFATNCIKAGFDIKTLSEILGHASVETTLKLYVHSSMKRKIECMNKLKLIT